jgi:ribosomal protein S18 acetylase RimI-like enzyme
MVLGRVREIELSQTTADDVDFLWDTFRISMKDYITQARGEWNEQREKSQFRHQLELSAAQVIRSNDLEVGFIMAPIKDDARWIHTMCIAPEHQRKGIGTEILRRVIGQTKEQKISLYLSVLKVNPARRLYERLGFRVIEETTHHFIIRCNFMPFRDQKQELAENAHLTDRAFADLD